MKKKRRELTWKAVMECNKTLRAEVTRMKDEHAREQFVRRGIAKELATQGQALAKANARIRSRSGWSFWRRLWFLVTGK